MWIIAIKCRGRLLTVKAHATYSQPQKEGLVPAKSTFPVLTVDYNTAPILVARYWITFCRPLL